MILRIFWGILQLENGINMKPQGVYLEPAAHQRVGPKKGSIVAGGFVPQLREAGDWYVLVCRRLRQSCECEHFCIFLGRTSGFLGVGEVNDGCLLCVALCR